MASLPSERILAVRPVRCVTGALACAAALVASSACGTDDPGPDPGAGELLFASNRIFGQFDVFVLDLADRTQRRVTDTLGFDFWPSWSPDGARIAFQSDRGFNQDTVFDQDIYLMNADGTGAVQLTSHDSTDAQPAWSPDSTRIAFSSNRTGNYEIYVVNTDGSSLVQLTVAPGADGQPAWSPDGARIAFASDRDGDADIYTMNAADGTGVLQLTANTDGDLGPAWSPDGTRIAFHSDSTGNFAIYVMNADGSGKRRLTAGGVPPQELADWSPDGTRIAYDSDGDLFVLWLDGRGATRVAGDQTNAFFRPRWRP